MRQIPLSTAAEKSGGLLSLLVLGGLLVALLLWSEGFTFWLILIAGASVLLLLAVYSAAIFTASVQVKGEEKRLQVRGIGGGEIDVSGAVRVCTEEVRLGSLVSRRIVFHGPEGEEVASVVPMMTSRRGGHAETAAEALADALDLQFVPTVEKHLYDRRAAREKRRSDEEAARRARGEKRKVRRDVYPTPTVKPSPALGVAEPEINYDELDDLK